MILFSSNLLYVSILIIFSISCKSTSEEFLWPADGTRLHSLKYKLSINDSSKILVYHQNYYSIIMPEDSLKTNQFDINYTSVNSKAEDYFKTRASDAVTNTSNPNITEYYKFKEGNVLFLGYSTGSISKPYTIFEPSLNISPSISNSKPVHEGKLTESTGMMKTFNSQTNSFNDGFKTKLKVKEIKTINLRLNSGKINKCYLRTLTLTCDAAISYGEKNLIVPEAILLSSKVIIDEKGYPIAEWSIKSEGSGSEVKEETKMKERKFYIEFTRYNKQ